MAPFLVLPLLAIALCPIAAIGQTGVASLDRPRVIALARERAPDVLRALEQVRAAEARIASAERLSASNPSLQASAGPRFGTTVQAEADVSAWLPVPLLVDRARALEAARAGVAAAELDVEAMRLASVGVALDLYVEVLYAQERLQLAKDRAALAERLAAAAAARVEAGDAPRLEVELAEAEKAASLAEVLAAEAALVEATGDLAFALGLPALESKDVEGDLAAQMSSPDVEGSDVEGLLARALSERPDIAAAEAALEAARAEVERAELGWLPALSVGAGYGLEEGAHIGTLGAAVTVPLFNFGQAERAEADAFRAREAREVELRRLAARVEVTRAFAVHQKALAAARLLEAEALPRAFASAELVAAGYAAGKTDLAALLVVRRDVLAIRAEHLARQRDAALAANQLVVVVGTVPATSTEVNRTSPRTTSPRTTSPRTTRPRTTRPQAPTRRTP